MAFVDDDEPVPVEHLGGVFAPRQGLQGQQQIDNPLRRVRPAPS